MITPYRDLPQALQEEGGWKRAVRQRSLEPPALLSARFGSRVKFRATFNETIVFIGHGYVVGIHHKQKVILRARFSLPPGLYRPCAGRESVS